MKRSSYRILHMLKTACPKLRNCIISNCDKRLFDISECVLNVLNGNVKLSDSTKR
jgi:hypothetical protein